MADTTLSVTVYGGVSPQNIEVTFFKDNEEIPENKFSSPTSFSKSYINLGSGVYDIFIAGVNPISAGSATKCEIDTTQITLHPPDQTPVIKKGKMYLTQFNFTV